MNPLDHATPAALFGEETVSDRRALKKAYARLIRRFDPERHPEAFTHIRRLYELARSGVVHAPSAPPPSSGTPAAFVLDDWLATLSADTYVHALERLRQHVLLTSDSDAAVVLFGCLDATAPEEVPALIAELCRNPDLQQQVCVPFARETLTLRPELVRDPAWASACAQVEDGWVLAMLAFARMDAWEQLDAPAEVAGVFREVHDKVRPLAPDAHARLVLRVLLIGGFELDATLLDIVAAALSQYGFQAEEDDVAAALEHVRYLRAWRAAHADPNVPKAFLDCLRWGTGQVGVSVVVLLRDLTEALPPAALAHLFGHLHKDWPQLLAALDQMVVRATRRDDWLVAWVDQGGAPQVQGELAAQQLPRVAAWLDAPSTPPKAEHTPWEARDWAELGMLYGGAWVAILFSAVALQQTLFPGVPADRVATMVLLLGGLSVFPLWFPFSESIQERADRRTTPTQQQHKDDGVWEAALRDRVEQGLWSHDLTGLLQVLAPHTAMRKAEAWMLDRSADLRDIGDAHYRTALHRSTVEPPPDPQSTP